MKREKLQKWLLILLAVILLIGMILPAMFGYAAEEVAWVSADYSDDHVTVEGQTDPSDPKQVPLMVMDARGQLLFVRDVEGGGKPFQVGFDLPEWTEEGTATVSLFSGKTVKSSFSISSASTPIRKKLEIKVRIAGYEGEEILKQQTVRVTNGSTAYHLLQYICNENDLDFEVEDKDRDGKDVYIKSIDGLAEFDKGPGSGWVYLVNGEQLQMPVDRYKLEKGDTVEFLYTTDFGESEGGKAERKSTRTYQSSASSELERALSQIGFAQDADELVAIIGQMMFELAEYDGEKQKQWIPDVAVVLQAAYEKAGMLKDEDVRRKPSSKFLAQELTKTMVDELLKEQQDVHKRLRDRIRGFVHYKDLLNQVQPIVMVPLDEKAEFHTWQLQIDSAAWEALQKGGAILGLLHQDWRVDLIPQEKLSGAEAQLTFTVKFPSEQEQTAMLDSLSAEITPLTDVYGFGFSKPQAARFHVKWLLDGKLAPEERAVLYGRNTDQENWQVQSVLVATDREFATAKHVPAKEVVVVSQAKRVFADVEALPKTSDWMREPIEALTAIGVIRGVSSDRFHVHGLLKRTDALALVSRLAGKEINIAESQANRSTEEPISRAEWAYLLVQAASIRSAHDGSAKEVVFSDAERIPDWAQESVRQAASRGLLNGRTDGRFDPLAPLTRAEAAAALYRLIKQE